MSKKKMKKTIQLPFDVELLPLKIFKTSKFSFGYERGNIRYIKIGTDEAIRMIYIGLRDEKWNTIPYEIEDEKIEEKVNGIVISYVSVFRANGIHFRAAILIEAKDDSLIFSMKGEAISSFKRNRIGICVLHPIKESMGKEVQVKKADGTEDNANFTELISPWQCFRNITQMQWPANENTDLRLEFYGDVFETEDQRNWSDYSFKTYSTSLEHPIPVLVNPGDIVEQKIVMTFIPKKNTPVPAIPPVSLSQKMPFPKIGYNRVGGTPLNNEQISLLQQVPFDHYRVELLLYANAWKDELDNAIKEAKKLATKLALVIYFSENYERELKDFIDISKDMKNEIESVLVLQVHHKATPIPLLKIVYPVLKSISPGIKIGYGTDGPFADINRNLPQHPDYDFIGFRLNPQSHLNDTRTLIENLDAQRDISETLIHHIGNGKEIHIFINFRKAIANHAADNMVPADYDERLHSSFGAAWTLLAIRNFPTACLFLYDAVGYKGVISDEHIAGNNPSAIYKVLREIRGFEPVWMLPSGVTDVAEMVLENGDGDQLLFNLNSRYFMYALGQ